MRFSILKAFNRYAEDSVKDPPNPKMVWYLSLGSKAIFEWFSALENAPEKDVTGLSLCPPLEVSTISMNNDFSGEKEHTIIKIKIKKSRLKALFINL